MIFRDVRRLLTLAALLCTVTPSFASGLQSVQPETCQKPHYPAKAQKAEEEGISLIGFLVRADGKVARSVVLNSSGSRTLDHAAEAALSRCLFKPAANSNDPVERWEYVAYAWYLGDGFNMLRPKQAAALAAGKGNLAARYHLSLLLSATAENDADREKALVVLRSSAELGHAHAQFDLGRRYENGDGVKADLDEALRWYQKSSAQGDPFAMQRLRLRKLPD